MHGTRDNADGDHVDECGYRLREHQRGAGEVRAQHVRNLDGERKPDEQIDDVVGQGGHDAEDDIAVELPFAREVGARERASSCRQERRDDAEFSGSSAATKEP